MVDNDFLIATQSDPNIVGQLMAWQMLKQTEDWPPRSLHDMVVMANKMGHVVSRICPPPAQFFGYVEGAEAVDEPEFPDEDDE